MMDVEDSRAPLNTEAQGAEERSVRERLAPVLRGRQPVVSDMSLRLLPKIQALSDLREYNLVILTECLGRTDLPAVKGESRRDWHRFTTQSVEKGRPSGDLLKEPEIKIKSGTRAIVLDIERLDGYETVVVLPTEGVSKGEVLRVLGVDCHPLISGPIQSDEVKKRFETSGLPLAKSRLIKTLKPRTFRLEGCTPSVANHYNYTGHEYVIESGSEIQIMGVGPDAYAALVVDKSLRVRTLVFIPKSLIESE